MKHLILSFTLIFLTILNAAAQDIVTLKTGDELNGKILMLNPRDVVFIPKGISDTMVILRDDISRLRYQNGTLVLLVEKNTEIKESNSETLSGYDSIYYLGISDANNYYIGYTGAFVGTLVSAMLFPFNLIPAIACSATPPNEYHLTLPNHQLSQNPVYLNGYRKQAHKIKKHKVWMGFGIGSGAMIAFYILIGAI
jgi:hypothetical protein